MRLMAKNAAPTVVLRAQRSNKDDPDEGAAVGDSARARARGRGVREGHALATGIAFDASSRHPPHTRTGCKR